MMEKVNKLALVGMEGIRSLSERLLLLSVERDVGETHAQTCTF